MNISKEDYIKAIFKLQKESCTNKNLAQFLGISAPSVTEMIRKLIADGLVHHEGRKIFLSEKGNALAKNIVRKHRIWEVFLTEKLSYEPHRVHDIAELFEHVTDDELLERLERFLDHPKVCPHGKNIDL